MSEKKPHTETEVRIAKLEKKVAELERLTRELDSRTIGQTRFG